MHHPRPHTSESHGQSLCCHGHNSQTFLPHGRLAPGLPAPTGRQDSEVQLMRPDQVLRMKHVCCQLWQLLSSACHRRGGPSHAITFHLTCRFAAEIFAAVLRRRSGGRHFWVFLSALAFAARLCGHFKNLTHLSICWPPLSPVFTSVSSDSVSGAELWKWVSVSLCASTDCGKPLRWNVSVKLHSAMLSLIPRSPNTDALGW